ncbi:MAG: MFS transporter [Betaproteobacteria bacterium]|nr:MAG: MFS transporter [Betaproteobacteria bacterium]
MSEQSQFGLLSERRFAPFFWTQFLGAMNDNVFKNGMVIFIAFGGLTLAGMSSNLLVNAAGAIFILPFVLFSAFAGQLADKYEKSRLIRATKWLEIAIMVLGALGFVLGNIAILFFALFLMGLQSTLFGPVKYAILPQVLKDSELVGGNAIVESGTFVAILIGTIAGGVLIAIKPSGTTVVAVVCIALAIAGYLASRAIPRVEAVDPTLKLNWNPFTETYRSIVLGRKNVVVWRSMLGISWLWFYGAMLLNQFAPMAKDVLHGNEAVATALLAVFAIGIAIGSLLCERLSGHKVEIGLVPLGSIGMTVFALDLYFALKGLPPQAASASPIGAGEFFANSAHWRVVFDLFMLSLSGGLFSVPLYALIQERSEPTYRSRIIAANNIVNAVFMVASALLAMALIQFFDFGVKELILTIAVLNGIVALYIYILTPEFLLRFVCWIIMSLSYKLKVKGLENIPDKGPVIIVANHVSYVDALVISAAVRRPLQFVMDHNIFKTPGLGWVFRQMKAIPISGAKEDPAKMEEAFARVRQALADGDAVAVFPEGKLTSTGDMNPFRPGIERIVSETGAPVVPIALRGLWGSFFSRAKEGKAFRTFRGFLNKVEVEAGALVPAGSVSAKGLEERVAQMRGAAK